MPHRISAPDLQSLLQLQSVDANTFRSINNERNVNGRIYGGQIMGQLVLAAAGSIDAGRDPTVLQMVFMQGASADQSLDYAVRPLQDGRRFSSRHVAVTQNGVPIVDAHLSFQTPADGAIDHQPSHGPIPAAPEAHPPPQLLDPVTVEKMKQAGYFGFHLHPFIEARIAYPEQPFIPDVPAAEFKMWTRLRQPFSAEPMMQNAALAYLSDWWLAYCGYSFLIGTASSQNRIYVATLNHALWFHAPCRADEWLLYVCKTLRLGGNRGLVSGQLYTTRGVLVASATQESLQMPVPSA